jgi:hypothetical protein
MAVLLIGATAALFFAVRQRSSAAMFVFGLLAGVATTIKPTALPLSVAQLTIALFVLRNAASRGSPVQGAGPFEMRYPATKALAGMAIGPLAALGFLLRQRSVGAFWAAMRWPWTQAAWLPAGT